MNIQENSQKNIDYYKELKTVKKEIEKIYNLLSKNESLSEMIESIQKDLNTNITFILTNLTKPKSTYKESNPKIIKILMLLISLLEKFTAYSSYIETYKQVKPNVDTYNIDLRNNDITNMSAIEQIIKNIESSGTVSNTEHLFHIKVFIKHTLTFKYYLERFEKNKLSNDDNTVIKGIENEISVAKPEEKEVLNKKLEDRKIELDKEKYRTILNYIQISSFEIFDYVDKRYDELTDTSDDEKESNDVKEKRKEVADKFIDDFKKEIYYTFININNTRSNDPETRQYEFGNEKIDLEARKKLLEGLKEELDKQLNTLNGIINFLVDSSKQEYSKEITDVNKVFKDYKKEKEYKDNILSLVVNEEGEISKLLDKNKNDQKILDQKIEMQRKELERDLQDRKRGLNVGGRRMHGGEKKLNKYYEDKYKPLSNLIEAVGKLIKEIAKIEGKEDADKDPFSKKNGMFGDSGDGIHSIYNNIWKDYKKEMTKIKSKGVSIDSLKQDTRLYERFKMNELDPQDVLKISFQDKVIFICVVLIIRTFAMVLIELLIEYNFVSTLSRGILVYSILYILLLFVSVLIINYDSYKLRILVNYLNVHINSSNIFFHVLLFALFIGLILIIINDSDGNNNLKGIDNIFNYTYIYTYIYEIAEKSNPASDLLLSQKEKVKLQYRMDIITMIIFIFSSLLILIM
jgi:hypothetical protein